MDKYKDEIIKLIGQHGPLGVNALAKELDVAVSTLQKYLHRQRYFKINESKKWDLPENVASDIKANTLELMTNMVENSILLLKSQLEEMQLSVNNSLVPLSTLKRGISSVITPVADNSEESTIQIDKRLRELHSDAIKLQSILSKQKDNIPDEYKDLIFGYDHVGLILKEGKPYTIDFLEGEIYSMLSGNARTLSEETIQILKDNQKEQ